jgi:hypothetical protein
MNVAGTSSQNPRMAALVVTGAATVAPLGWTVNDDAV